MAGRSLALGLGLTLALAAATGAAEEQKKKKEKHRNTPLDTLMQTRLWTDTPEPKDFVKEHRPPASRLEYKPVTGTDPERPKLRTPAELKDLESELDTARLSADKRAGIKPAPAQSTPAKQKPAAE